MRRGIRYWVNYFLKWQMVRYIIASSLSLILDVCIYTFTFSLFRPFLVQFVSSTFGMLLNFKLQHDFVFTEKRRKKSHLFMMSTAGSIVGIFIGSGLIEFLHSLSFMADRPVWNKIIVVGVVFVYNYATKKYIFSLA